MAASAARYRDMLGQPALRLLLLGDLSNGVGTWAFNTVFAYVLYARTGSAAWVTAGLAVRLGALVVSGPFAGVVGDRYDRRRVMMASASASGVVMAVLAACVGLRTPLWTLLVLTALASVVSSGYGPAFAATLPDVVPGRLLAGANGLREIIANIAVVVGPLFATAFLVAGVPSLGVALNAISYVLPLLAAARLQLGFSSRGDAELHVFAELHEGVSAIRARPTTLLLLFAMAFDSGLAGVVTSLALPIGIHVGYQRSNYAYLLIAFSLGSVLAAGLAGRLASRSRLAPVLTVSLCAQAFPVAMLALFPHRIPALVLVLISGTGMIVVDILAVTALQRDTPRELMSRVFGILDTVLLLFTVVFALAAGLLVSAVGLGPVLLVFGFGVTVVVLAGTPALASLDRRTAARTAELKPVVDLLRRLELFDGADHVALEALAATAVARTVRAGTVLIREGDPADDLWLLDAGTLAVEATGNRLPDVHAPGFVGEIGLVHERPRTASVTAATDCEVLRIPGRDFLDVLTAGPVSRSLTLVSGERLARTDA